MIKISNKHKYTFLRFSSFLFAPFYSILSIFIKKNNNIIITGSLNNEFSDNAKALFEMLIKNELYNKRVYFVINDEQKRAHFNSLYPEKIISNKGFKNKLFILQAKYWFFSAMEMPLTTFAQRELRQCIHLGHGMLYKKVGLLENKVSWYKKLYYKLIVSNFSYTISTSNFFKKYIALSFGIDINRVLVLPQAKTYQISAPLEVELFNSFCQNTKHILYAPTWRPYENVTLFAFNDLNLETLQQFLEKNKLHIWLRVHPRFEQDIDKNILKNNNIHLFSAKEYSEINQYLEYFDILISDYSSIYFDFITLNRPVLFFDYDLQKYNDFVGLIDEYKTIKATQTIITQTEFIKQLKSILNNNYDLNKIKEINNLVNFNIENKRIEKYLVKKLFDF